MITLRTPSGLKEVAPYVRTATGLKQVGEVWLRTAAGLKKVFSSFGGDTGLTATPNAVYGSTNSHAFQRIGTGQTTITIAGGGGFDSIGWAFDDTGWDVITPGSLTTGFRSPPVGPGDTALTTITCTVTKGGIPATVELTAECSNYGS
ncbi:hypothetical protein FPZ24_08110 [Sphingomonas panacisoli]|uniref:Uncharacterized protein n=1 Tax=Sphingomonas panacisoli TaxID=1813879 RepID=A0A5B8LGU1_9SPHN|nr:hypothetical protein [Sphingomonas panacisoli]QDZ07447.1 hypothetical protein FPZ24_08110 [Sphingomonas panacisoli]